MLIGSVLPFEDARERYLGHRTWCVWDRSSGRLLYSSEARDLQWAGGQLAELGWCAPDAADSYSIRLLALPTFEEVRRHSFAAPAGLDAQTLTPLAAPRAWMYDRSCDKTPADWIKRADEALYEAKEGGRNRVMSTLPPRL